MTETELASVVQATDTSPKPAPAPAPKPAAAAAPAPAYTTSSLLIADPQDVHVLAPTEAPNATLVPCYPLYYVGKAPRRYIVQAHLETPGEGFDDTGG